MMLIDRFETMEAYFDSPYVHGVAERVRMEHKILERGAAGLHAYCWACSRIEQLEINPVRAGHGGLQWREALRCPRCNLTARKRLGLHLLAESMQPGAPPPYLTEQVSYSFVAARRIWPKLIASEFLPTRTQRVVESQKIKFLTRNIFLKARHEDLTALSLRDASIGGMLSMDVLEHIADTKAVLREARRVLVPGAPLVMTAPFLNGSRATSVRAVQEADGSIRHLLEPEYHGDPLDPAGVLCFYHFGWDLLDSLRDAGFARAEMVFPWDPHFGYLSEQTAFLAFA